MELPQRKPNRLCSCDYSQNGAYFVIVCTKDREKLLSEIVGDDARIVLKGCGKIAEKYMRNIPEIEKYIIMPDHIHMIIRLDNGSMWASTPTNAKEDMSVGADAHIRPRNMISNIVRSIKTLTTKEIGKSVFQRSYYDHIIRNRRDYDEIWEYIENNPRKWILDGK